MPQAHGNDTSPGRGSPPTDRARVARLRRAIAAGTYRVDPTAIAEALLTTGIIDPESAD